MKFIATAPTAVYRRTSRHRRWELLHFGTALKCQAIGDEWRAEVFDFESQRIGETLTIPAGNLPQQTLPRNYTA